MSKYNKVGLASCLTAVSSRSLAWPETLDLVSSSGSSSVDVLDDFKRESLFYEIAKQAVEEGFRLCGDHGVPFRRPTDFFCEMLKSDQHMDAVKDRLIFESKKMDSFEKRKRDKEERGRQKEKRDLTARRKAQFKRDNIDRMADEFSGDPNEGSSFNNKRKKSDAKFGFGGKRGKFRSNPTRKEHNDMSSYNPRGNFQGGSKSSAKKQVKAKRPGKRDRDRKRSGK